MIRHNWKPHGCTGAHHTCQLDPRYDPHEVLLSRSVACMQAREPKCTKQEDQLAPGASHVRQGIGDGACMSAPTAVSSGTAAALGTGTSLRMRCGPAHCGRTGIGTPTHHRGPLKCIRRDGGILSAEVTKRHPQGSRRQGCRAKDATRMN